MTSVQIAEIIDILTEDARLTPQVIASMIGADASEVAQAIKQLEKEHIILKYSAIVNEERTDKSNGVQALIEVSVAPQFRVGYESIADYISKYEEVRSCYLMSGSYDYMIEVEGKTLRDVARFVAEKLAVLDGVTATSTHFVLRKYKDKGVLMPVLEEDGRQVVTA